MQDRVHPGTALKFKGTKPGVPCMSPTTEPPRAQGGLFIPILGFFAKKETPCFLWGCRAGMQRVLPAPLARAHGTPCHRAEDTSSPPAPSPIGFHPRFDSILFK